MIRTRVALGIAAVALSLTSLMVPAAPASAAPLFKPDLKVTFAYQHPITGNYVFTIKNIGSVASGPIAVKELCAYLGNDGFKNLINGGHVLPGLGAGKQTQTSISCGISSWGTSAFGARLEAGTQDDLDTSNNQAESPSYSNPSGY